MRCWVWGLAAIKSKRFGHWTVWSIWYRWSESCCICCEDKSVRIVCKHRFWSSVCRRALSDARRASLPMHHFRLTNASLECLYEESDTTEVSKISLIVGVILCSIIIGIVALSVHHRMQRLRRKWPSPPLSKSSIMIRLKYLSINRRSIARWDYLHSLNDLNILSQSLGRDEWRCRQAFDCNGQTRTISCLPDRRRLIVRQACRVTRLAAV